MNIAYRPCMVGPLVCGLHSQSQQGVQVGMKFSIPSDADPKNIKFRTILLVSNSEI